MSGRSILILSPTRNEARSAPLVMGEIAAASAQLALLGWELSLLVIDDQSTDGTADVIRSEAAIRGISVEVRQGPGSGLSRAMTAGLKEALIRQPTLIATFDFDGQHDAGQLPLLVAAWEGSSRVDVVFGSRFASGATVTGVRGFRKLISRAAQWAVQAATAGPKVPSDSTTSLRIFTPRVAQEFLNEIPSRGLDGYRLFSWFAVFTSCRFGYAEVPINFRPRLTGVSKLRRADLVSFAFGLRTLRELSKDWVRQVRQAEIFPEYPNEFLDDLGELDVYNDWIIGTFARELHGRVADVGAGTGTVTRVICKLPAVRSVVAFEPDPVRHVVLVEATKDIQNVECVNGTLADSGSEFDCLLYCNSLEHIEGVLNELRQAALACREGGHLVVFGPAMELIYGEVDRLSGHFRRFTIGTLSRCVEEVGFEVVEAQYLDPLGALLYGVSNRLLRNGSLRTGLLPLYEKVVLPLSKAATPLTRRLAGKNIVLIARRTSFGDDPVENPEAVS